MTSPFPNITQTWREQIYQPACDKQLLITEGDSIGAGIEKAIANRILNSIDHYKNSSFSWMKIMDQIEELESVIKRHHNLPGVNRENKAVETLKYLEMMDACKLAKEKMKVIYQGIKSVEQIIINISRKK